MKLHLLASTALIAGFVLGAPLNAADPASDTIVAKVDGKDITYSQVMAEKDKLPKKAQELPAETLFPVLQNQVVDVKLIEKAAAGSGLANDPKVKEAVQKMTQQLIDQAYLAKQIEGAVTDAAIKAKYDEIVKNFPKEKEIKVRHILVKDEATAKQIVKALKGGSDFAKLAKEKSTDGTAKDGGELGYITKDAVVKEFSDVAFALEVGAYNETPVKTDFGWHVIKVEDKRDAKAPTFEEAKEELKALMAEEAILKLLKDLRATAKIELFDKDGKPLPTAPAPAAPAAVPAPAVPASAAPAAPTPAEAPKK
ncbi:Putative parvulin-type peptidyl-prolyl cis-trans isomerase precursor [Candidatus Bealeia paramacronuclearis]|uniref:Parvulin-like PPIase n=1 Tax=Candidatus Bealeia paramacronuclearis TaxID=1921001 RepID=A0ABZ2C3F3_9PROT|nr:putative parvulin-type peptidyl-prolyl cis-trans isomerase precursor [Candidatus Bealeia paramacronuclearis]